MRVITVYRVDYARRTRNPIGVVLGKRETERLHNPIAIAHLIPRDLLMRAMAAGACRSTTRGGDGKCSGP